MKAKKVIKKIETWFATKDRDYEDGRQLLNSVEEGRHLYLQIPAVEKYSDRLRLYKALHLLTSMLKN